MNNNEIQLGRFVPNTGWILPIKSVKSLANSFREEVTKHKVLHKSKKML